MNILFLGDSITDCDHCFSPDNLGFGYVKYFSELSMKEAGILRNELHITNGGSDGFTFSRILQKWKSMYNEHHWDVVCILGGINDISYAMELNTIRNSEHISDESRRYLAGSVSSLQELLSSVTSADVQKTILLEPFLFEHPAYLITWKPMLHLLNNMINGCCSNYFNKTQSETTSGNNPASNITFLPLQDFFNQLACTYGSSSLSTDGIHLTEFGHRKLAEYLFSYIMQLK